MSNTLLETTIPFEGFYHSHISQMLDDEIEREFDPAGNGSGKVPESFYMGNHFCYSSAYLAMAKLYLEEFNDWINKEFNLSVKLEWSLMTSPKEYNFQTDRIFCNVSPDDLKLIIKAAMQEYGENCIEEKAKELFTSRSGFISFYSPDVSEWPKDVAEWDHNQLGAIMACFEAPESYSLLENASGNGAITEIIWNWLSPTMKGIITKRHNTERKKWEK